MDQFSSTLSSTHPRAMLIEKPITNTLAKSKGKTPGFDRISYKVIKSTSSLKRSRLVSLYNTILDSGVIPHSFKIATVMPIPKVNEDSPDTNGYRAISLLSYISKILERIITNRIAWFLQTLQLIANIQVAFKRNSGQTLSSIPIIT